jgi:hypothetical protein
MIPGNSARRFGWIARPAATFAVRSLGSRQRRALDAAALAFALVAWFAGGIRAEAVKSTPAEQKSVSITIYNQDLGLVKDVRGVTLPTGVADLMFEGVAARIDPTSVHIRSLSRPEDLSVLEQNFEYDLISPAKLMEKYVGQTVELVVVREDHEIWSKARLIGIENGYVYEMDGKIAVNPPGRVVLPELPQGLFSKPTLVWMLDSSAKEHEIEASYLTAGIGWKADYVLVLSQDDRQVDVAGWVTIDNRSGATYTDASVKLVAGDVHRAPSKQDVVLLGEALHARGGRAAPPQFEEEAFFEYHLYTLQRKTTIRDNQTKQISLLEAPDVSIEKTYVFQPRSGYWFAPMPTPEKDTKIGVFLNLENSKSKGMGMPLPKGVVRVYKKDADASLQFVGEDAIDHTPEDEKVRVKMGEAFDIVGEKVQTDYNRIATGEVYESSYRVTLRNHKKEAVVVQVVEMVPGDWEVTKSSHEFEKEAANRIRFDLPVAAKGEIELTYTVRITY